MANNDAQIDVTVKVHDEASATFKSIESSIIRFVGTVSSLLTAFAVVAFPVKAAADFEAELINVAKTTNFTNDQISTLRGGLVALSKQVDITATDLAKIAATAGQLGLGKEGGVEGIRQFTETTARFASVINVSVEEAGQGIARLLNIYQIGVKDSERVSSLLNEISNNSTASGKDLLDVIQRIGTAGGVLNIKQAAALAAVGRDLGLTLETTGTSFQKVFLNLQTDAERIAPIIGIPVTKFLSVLKEDGIAGLNLYTSALAKMDLATRSAFIQQSTGGGRIFDLVTKLANDAENGYKLLNKQLGNAEVGFEGGTSAIREQQRVMEGLNKQLQLVINGFLNLATEVGNRAIPFLTDLARQLQEFLSDPRTVDRVVEFGKTVGNWAAIFVEAAKSLTILLDNLGPLVRLLQLFVGYKILQGLAAIVTYFLDIGKSASTAYVQLRALWTGQAQQAAVLTETQLKTIALNKDIAASEAAVAAARSKAAVAGATRVPTGLAGAAAAVGNETNARAAALAKVREAEAVAASAAIDAIAAQKAGEAELQRQRAVAAATQRTHMAALKVSWEAGLVAQANILRLEQEIAVARASSDPALRSTIRSLNAKLVYQRDILASEAATLVARREEALIAAQNIALVEREGLAYAAKAAAATALAQGAAANAAAAVGKAAAASTIPPVIAVAQNTFKALFSSIAGLFTRIFAFLLNPIVLIGALIAQGIYTAFETQIDSFFGKLLGLSKNATVVQEQESRLREARLKKEQEQVRNLADEYDKLAGDKRFKEASADLTKDVGTDKFASNFSETVKQLTLIDAKLRAVRGEVSETLLTEKSIRSAIQETSIEYYRQLGVLQNLTSEQAQRNAVARDASLPELLGAGRNSTVEKLADDIIVATERAEALAKKLADLNTAQRGVGNDRAGLVGQIPQLETLRRERYQALAPVVDADTLALLKQAQVIATLREAAQQQSVELRRLQNAAERPDRTDKDLREFQVARDTLRALGAQLTALDADFTLAKARATSLVRDTVNSVAGDVLKVSKAELVGLVDIFSAILESGTASFDADITASTQKLRKLEADGDRIRARRNEQLSGNRPGDVEDSTKRLSDNEREQEILRVRIDRAKELRGLSLESARSEEKIAAARRTVSIVEVQQALQTGAKLQVLRKLSVAQDAFLTSAKESAAAYKALYEQAANDAQSAIVKQLSENARLQQVSRDRAKNIEQANFDVIAARAKKTSDRVIDLNLQREKRDIDLLGLTPEEKEQAIFNAEERANAIREIRDKAIEAARVRDQFDRASRNAKKLADELANSQGQQQAIAEIQKNEEAKIATLKGATNEADVAERTRLAKRVAERQEKLKELQANAQVTLDELEAQRNELRTAATSVGQGVFAGVIPAVEEKAALDRLKAVNDAIAAFKKANASVLKGISGTEQATATSADTLLSETNKELAKTEKLAQSLANKYEISLTQMLEKSSKLFLDNNIQLQELITLSEEVARFNFPDLQRIAETQVEFTRAAKEGLKALEQQAKNVATVMVDSGLGKNSADIIKNVSLQLKLDQTLAEAEIAAKAMAKEVQQRSLFIKGIVGVDANAMVSALQADLKKVPPVEINAKFVTTPGGAAIGAPQLGRAAGGPIYGAGTGTSDSILARVSHGEYVSDAGTVSAFGPDFFAFLKSISRRGGSAVASFLSAFKGVPLPGFSGGGFIDLAGGGLGGAAVAGSGSMDTVRIELSVGGQSAVLYTERDEARALTKMLKNIGRSA